MKWILSISFLSLFIPAFPQESLTLMTKQVTNSEQTEKEKVTAIFNWITSNISYRVKTNSRIATTIPANFVIEDKTPPKSLNERVAEEVLKKRVAVCDGYARLFTTLCNYAGIRSEIIVGYAKSGNNKPTPRFGVNHYWNAVMIDSNWYLLDATWASGYVSKQRNEFIQEYDGDYFLTPPKTFILDHYPDDARWTLLPDSEVPDEFLKSPFKQKSFSKYKIDSFYPAKGVIETFVGDTIRLKLETAKNELDRKVSPCSITDSTLFYHSPSWVFLNPDKKSMGGAENENIYNYTIPSVNIEWLYLLYNDDLVLKYKINVRKKEPN